MKILQVIDTLDVGGAERVFVDICNILQENDQDVTALILLKDSGDLAENLKTPLLKLNRISKWSLFTMYKCSRILKEYEVIHCHLRHVFSYIAIVNLVFRTKTKIIFHDHGSSKVGWQKTFLFKYLIRPKFYIGVSENNLIWAKEKLKMIKNLFLVENIIRKRVQVNSLEKKYDFVLVSNIKPNKNNLFAIELCKKVKSSLLLIGKNQNQNYYNKIKEEESDNIIINEKITDSQSIISTAKIGLHTSSLETGPLVLIEYLAQRIPFLAYETGEVAKILKPYFPDFFIDDFSLENWESRLNSISNMCIDYKKMDFVYNKYFGEKQYFDKIMKVYLCTSKN